jgi:hypothetical protein
MVLHICEYTYYPLLGFEGLVRSGFLPPPGGWTGTTPVAYFCRTCRQPDRTSSNRFLLVAHQLIDRSKPVLVVTEHQLVQTSGDRSVVVNLTPFLVFIAVVATVVYYMFVCYTHTNSLHIFVFCHFVYRSVSVFCVLSFYVS